MGEEERGGMRKVVVEVGELLGARGFFFNETATTEIYPLSLPDALPIYGFTNKAQERISRYAPRTFRVEKWISLKRNPSWAAIQ